MKILYGIPSEGMGHATRSKVLIEHLLKEHDVRIVTSDRAYTFLDEFFPGKVYQIEGFHLAFKNGVVSKFKTFKETLKSSPKAIKVNFEKYIKVHKEFKPDLVISDFESFSFFYAKKYKLPIISIDNMQVIDRCELDIKIAKEEKKNMLVAKSVIKLKVPNCNHYLISSFFD